MNKKNFVPMIFACLLASLCCAPEVGAASNFEDIYNQTINTGIGTIEFNVKLLRDVSSDQHNHDFFLGTSSGGQESYEILIIQDQLIARRHFSHCLLTAFSSAHNFTPGIWHNIKLTWNKASTKFYIDNQQVQKIGPLSSDDLPKMIPCIRVGKEESFQIQGFKLSSDSDISEDPADQEFVKNSSCPNLSELVNQPAQEECRGIGLHNFPDQGSRDTIKSYIALLPDDFARSIKHVVFVNKERASGRGEGGLTDFESGSIMLEAKYFDDPTVFFHEAAHIYDNKQHIASGVPDEESEWVAISGATCYFKGADMNQFMETFEKTHVENAFLGGQGGECPPEDLAEWVGATYEYYIHNKSFADMLNPSSPKYSPKNQKKLDFLLRKGFFSDQIYLKVTRADKK